MPVEDDANENLNDDLLLDESEDDTLDETVVPTEEEPVEEDLEGKEDEEEEEEEEKEPPKIAFDRPTFKEIKAKYPELFKDFPSLRDAFFREAEFTRIFPTIEDAKEAFEDNEAFVSLRESVFEGDSSALMEAIEKSDANAFEKFTRSFLPSLYKRNSEIYTTVVTPLFENLVRQAYQNGARINNDDLKNAALHISQFLFGDSEVATGKTRASKDLPEEDKKTKAESAAAMERKFQEAYTDVSSTIEKNMVSLIRKDFDPEEVFTAFQRRLLIKEVLTKIGNQLQKDSGHMSVMNARWKRASLNGFTADDKSKIITAYLARAKSLIPAIRESVRSAALVVKEKSGQSKLQRTQPPRKEAVSGRSPSNSKGSPEKVDYRKMSDIDILGTD